MDDLWRQLASRVPAAELERLAAEAPARLDAALAAARERFGPGDPTRLD